jgi:hypothetical protein
MRCCKVDWTTIVKENCRQWKIKVWVKIKLLDEVRKSKSGTWRVVFWPQGNSIVHFVMQINDIFQQLELTVTRCLDFHNRFQGRLRVGLYLPKLHRQARQLKTFLTTLPKMNRWRECTLDEIFNKWEPKKST